MATFTYLAKQADGSSISGSIEAEDSKQAVELLRGRQFWVVSIRKEKIRRVAGVWQRLFYRVKPGPMALFFNGLLESVRAGISLSQALEVSQKTAPHRHLRNVSGEMAAPLRNGERLSSEMGKRPTLFPGLCTQLVRAGEESGHLERMLGVCAQYLEGLHEAEQAVKGATFYPKVLIGMAVVVVVAFAAVMHWLTGQKGAEISGEAKAVAIDPAYHTFSFITESLGILVLAAVGCFLAWRVLSLFPWFRRGFDTVKMYLPGISGITRRLVYSRFAKTLATCYAAGLPITRSVEIAGDTCGNEMVRLNCSRSIPALQSGAKLSEALGAVALLPPMIMQVIVTGETTGRLDETLRRASNIFDKEAESGIKGMIILTGLVSWAVVAVIFAIGIISFWSGYAKGISNLMP